MTKELQGVHCVKSVPIRSYSGPYSVRMRENAEQINSEYGHLVCDLVNTCTLLKHIFSGIKFNYKKECLDLKHNKKQAVKLVQLILRIRRNISKPF